jgi:hypothetical protein
MRNYEVAITGKTPLLMHWDNIEWADQMDKWKNDPKNKKNSKAGDDRTPAFRWIGSVYHDGNVVAMPSDNLMRCLMEGGAMVPVPGGRSGKTFKAQTQSGMLVGEPFWTFLARRKEIPFAKVSALTNELHFDAHQKFAADHGFILLVKRARIGQSKHIRVRPRFDEWSTSGTLNVWDDQITTDILQSIFEYAGRYKGLGDWRPGGKTPGPYGTFTAEIKET